MDGALVGSGCNVGDHAFIESGAVIGNRVTVLKAVLVWDRVRVEDDVFIARTSSSPTISDHEPR
jgi:UDP-2-acetamido-3-amino-2,3-dideoxy-glucuronate N-acetyltransferase